MSEREKRFQEAINQGHSAAWDQNWDRAAAFYKQALDEKPDDPKALNNLALAYFEMQEYAEALKTYLKVAEKTPNDPVPLEKASTLYEYLKKPEVGAEVAVRAAELYLQNKDIEKAIENWSLAVRMNPEHMAAHSRLAVVFERMGRKPQAVREYLHIASLMQHSGEKERAVQAVNRALGISPNSEEAHQALEMLRKGMELPKPARPTGGTGPIVETQQPQLAATKEKSDDVLNPVEEAAKKALAALANLFFEQTSEDQDAQTVRRGLQSIVDGTGPLFAKNVDTTKLMLHLGQAVESLTRDNKSEAADSLKHVIDIGLHHPAAYFSLGRLWMDSDRLESAIRHLQRSVSHVDFALGSRLLLGEALCKRGQIHEASIEYLEALSLADAIVVGPMHSDGLRQLYEPVIEAQAQNKDEKQSAQLCKTLSDLLMRPQWLKHLKNVRQQLLPQDENGDIPTPLAEALTEASSSEVVIAMSAVRQLAREGRHMAALEEALFALQHAPTYLPLHIAIGELLMSGGQLQAATEKFMVVARSYSVRGETGRAIDMLRKLVEMSPMDLSARTRLIDQLIARGEAEAAIEEYIKMAEVHYSLAELVEARKTYSRALRYAQQVGVGANWRVRILHRIADIDVQSLNWRQAMTVYEQICALKPDDIEAFQHLIDLNFRLGERAQALAFLENLFNFMNKEKRSESMLKFLEELVEERPQQAMIRQYLAEQYQIMGRQTDAVAEFDRAGEILLDGGDKDGAVRVIQRIIDLKPPNVKKYLQLSERIKSN
jgi:tetratricopeptide (TPR) repeat protein